MASFQCLGKIVPLQRINQSQVALQIATPPIDMGRIFPYWKFEHIFKNLKNKLFVILSQAHQF